MFSPSACFRRAALAGSVSAFALLPAPLPALLPAHAQTAPRGPVETLPEINVVANAAPTPTSETGSSVTVITGEQLQRTQRRTAPEALQTVPGLHVVQSGGPGGIASAFMRGTNSNHVKVFIDGVDASDPSSATGAVDLSKILTSDIERIEILRGPQGGLYGSDSIGGVIAISTKRGQGRPKVSLTSEAGSFGALNLAARLSGAHEAVDYSFSLSRIGANAVRATPSVFFPPNGAPVFASPGADAPNVFNNATGSARIGVQVSDRFRINATARYTDANLWFPYLPNALATRQSFTNDRHFQGRLEGEWTMLEGRLKHVFGVSRFNTRGWTSSPETVFGPIAPNLYVGARTKFDWRSEFAITPDHRVMAGVERQIETFDAPAFDPETQTAARGRTGNTGLFAQYTGRIADRFFIAANVRHDRHDAFGAHTSWRIAPAFHVPVAGTVLKASYGTGFKAPTLSQLYASYFSPFYNFYANPNLRPEESRGFDIGFEQPLLDDRVRFGATYFRNTIRNLIQIATLPPSAPFVFEQTLSNIGSAKTYGFEAFAALNLTPEFSLRADYTYTIARDATSIATAAGYLAEALRQAAEGTPQPDLLRRPRSKASVQATWRPMEKLSLSATLVRVGGWVDFDRIAFTRVKAPAHMLVNLAAEYEAAEGVTAFARVDNLFNKRYETPIGYLGPGVSGFGGVRLSF